MLKKLLHLFLLVFCCYSLSAQSVANTSITFNDPSRGGRSIPTEIFYPVDGSGTIIPGPHPVVVFGHGFLISYTQYSAIADFLVPKGYIVAFPDTETGFPNHGDFGADLAFVADAMQAENTNAGSVFFGNVSPFDAIGGHSMGGGAAFIASDGNTNIDAMFALSPAETDVSAIGAAANVSVPSLIIAGDDDCVVPNDPLDIYNNIGSSNAAYVDLAGGSHCNFANSDFICTLGEIGCGGNDQAEQETLFLELLCAFLDYHLKQDEQRICDYEDLLFDNDVDNGGTAYSEVLSVSNIDTDFCDAVPGCTNVCALNYDPLATQDDDSCVYPDPDDGCPLTVDSYDTVNCQIINAEPNVDDGCALTTDSFDVANCQIINAEPNVDDGCALTTDSFDVANCQIINAEPNVDDGCALTTDSFDVANCQIINAEPNVDDGCALTTDSFDVANCQIINAEPNVDDGCALTTDSFDVANCQIINAEPNVDDGCALTTDSFDAANCQIINAEPNVDDGCALTTDSFDAANCQIINAEPNVDDGCALTTDSFDAANCQIINAEPNVDDGCVLTTDSFDVVNCQIINAEPNVDDGCALTTDSFDVANCQIINAEPNVDDGCALTTDSFDVANCQIINAEPNVDDGCALTTDSFDVANCQIINAEPNVDDGCDLTTDSFDSANCQIVNAAPDCDDNDDTTIDSFDSANCTCVNESTIVEGCTNPCATNFDDNANSDDGSCEYPNPDDGCDLTTDSYDTANCQIINAEPDCDDNNDTTIDSFDTANCTCVNESTIVEGCTNPCATNFDDTANSDDGSCEYPNPDDGCDLTTDSYDEVNCVIINAEPSVDDGCDLTTDSFDAVNCIIINSAPDCDDNNDTTIDSFDTANCTCVNESTIVEGCTNPCATNFDDTANSDDGSCEYPNPDDGCDLTTDSYDTVNCVIINSEPNVDDGCALTTDSFDTANCQIINAEPDCDDNNDTTIDSFDTANCTCVNESTIVEGCTNPCATNFDDNANSDDGSCEYPNPDDGCDLTIDSYDIVNCQIVNEIPDVDDGCDVTIDSFDIVNCMVINTPDCPETTIYNSIDCTCFEYMGLPGCIDPCAFNYDPSASLDDGSCEYPNVDDGCDLTIDYIDSSTCIIINEAPDCDDGNPNTNDSFDIENCSCDNVLINEASAEIADPCSCDNPMNYILNGIEFVQDIIEISSEEGEIWTLDFIDGIFDDQGQLLDGGVAVEVNPGIYQFVIYYTFAGYSAGFTNQNNLSVEIESENISNCFDCSEPCQTFEVASNIECVSDNEFYNVVLTIQDTYSTYDITSAIDGAFNGTVDNFTLVDGPFPVGQGFEYVITASGTDCSFVLGSSTTSCTVTDLDLLDFKVSLLDDKGLLNWITASEKDMSHFEIEKSLDGISFEQIDRVEARNTSVEQTYDFIDTELANRQYYRLKMIDEDGTFEYSNIEQLVYVRAGFAITAIYPVPVIDNISVTISSNVDETIQIKLFDVNGKCITVFNESLISELQTIEIPVSNLSSGIYLLELSDKKGRVESGKFIKQ